MSHSPFGSQRWHIAPPQARLARDLAQELDLSPLMGQVLINRGLNTGEQVALFFDPDQIQLPDPETEFSDLTVCADRLAQAITQGEKIAICGDYDCDGMTSTALLLRVLRALGAKEAHYKIPDRIGEGYGINQRMVREIAQEGYGVLVTVDNGVSAPGPIALAVELGVDVLITDHHDLPAQLPVAPMLNPKLLPPSSPYRALAGVGVAYVLALTLAQRFGRGAELRDPLLELFTLGTVADMVPLVGVNRAWVQRGLSLLPHSQNPGIQSLMLVAGLTDQLKPESIGFGLGPRINAIGRIGDPELVVRLFTTDDPQEALTCAHLCEQTNRQRQELLATMEQEALAQVAQSNVDLRQQRILILAGEHWHHGIVGLVASRLKERTGCPTFVGVLEEGNVRGSARGIPEFNVYAALSHCRDHLTNFGGHPMAGGFGCTRENWPLFQKALEVYAQSVLEAQHVRPLVEIDAQASLSELSLDLLAELDRLHPCGMQNPEPVFWSTQVQVIDQRTMGKDKTHARLTVSDGITKLQVVAWRWGEYLPLPATVDMAYRLQENVFQGRRSLQLVLEGARPSTPQPGLTLAQPSRLAQAKMIAIAPPDPIAYIQDLAEQGRVLLYGYDRPEGLGVDYDRPQSGVQYTDLVFWSQPPAPVHQQWLISGSQPQRVHLLYQPVPLPDWDTVLDLVTQADPRIRLLALAQKHWLSPRSLLEAWQELRQFLHITPQPDWGATYRDLPQWYQGKIKDPST